MVKKPFQLLIKPAGSNCNLYCSYCFYRQTHKFSFTKSHYMSDEVLQEMVRGYLGLRFPYVVFCWQGGEPSLCGLSFYKRVVELQMRYGYNGQVIGNSFQTNGLLLDDEWCKFFSQYKFFIGLSLDGYREIHDTYRKGINGGSWEETIKAAKLLSDYKIEFNILSVVTRKSEIMAEELFKWFLENGFKYLQFIPCVEVSDNGEILPYSVTPEGYGNFLCELFDVWWENKEKSISIRTFDVVLEVILTGKSSMCIFYSYCDGYLVVDYNGNVYPCDFFVREDMRLGNLMNNHLDGLYSSETYKKFSREKADIPSECKKCEFLFLCNGGCQRDRLNSSGEKNYLCISYKTFFAYTLKRFTILAEEFKKKSN